MDTPKKVDSAGLSRREVLKLQSLALGGLAVGGCVPGGNCPDLDPVACPDVQSGSANRNTYFRAMRSFCLGSEPLAADEMRITFLGSWFSPRISQAANSIFVEVGNALGQSDQFVFDCGTGVMAKYNAMGIPASKMTKVFLTHLHGDHMSDLMHIYCFGPSADRKSPLYVWGPRSSGFQYTDLAGNASGPYADGTAAYCQLLREAARWHTESFSFQTTAFTDDYIRRNQLTPGWTCPSATPSAPPVGKDGYDLVAFELDWTKEGFDANGQPVSNNVAYDNPASGVKITHFPAVHARQGAISYKLEWNGMSMIFTGDTKPNYHVVRQATNGVDVLIHEMTPPPEIWVEKFTGLQEGDTGYDVVFADLNRVQQSSHTESKAYGYVLSLLSKAPRLAVGTHFPAEDDTIYSALEDLRVWYPSGDVVIASDLMVIKVAAGNIDVARAVVSDYTWTPSAPLASATYDPPKYWTWETNDDGSYVLDTGGNKIPVGDPYAQLYPGADIIPQSLWDV
ncbi:MAG: MBL fold metallo-hydrolase [Phycisphaerae bacterium]|nr:MBL fold metallo-hydrolase [Phycisphaerae bacterium]